MNPPTSDPDVTGLLRRLAGGDREAERDVYPLIYAELHALAATKLRGEGVDPVLQTTALVNEAYLRLAGTERILWSSRRHFLSFAARTMRRVLVDHARQRDTRRRDGGSRLPLDEAMAAIEERGLDVLFLDEYLTGLAELDETLARIVELRFFSGLSVPEVADVLDLSVRQVERRWESARAWLQARLDEERKR